MFNKISRIVCTLITVSLIIFLFVSLNCKSFEPIQIADQPPECNDMYTIMYMVIDGEKSYNPFSKKDKKDYSILLLVMEDCRSARKEIRKGVKENKCKDRVYGKGQSIVREEYKKYADFSDCMRE